MTEKRSLSEKAKATTLLLSRSQPSGAAAGEVNDSGISLLVAEIGIADACIRYARMRDLFGPDSRPHQRISVIRTNRAAALTE